MAVRRSFSPIIKTQTRLSAADNLRNSTKNNFRVQSAPPLSIQQYIRSVSVIPGSKQWKPSSQYRPPSYPRYLSPAVRPKPNVPEVKPWIDAYRRKHSIPTYSLKQFKDLKRKPVEPIWHPPGPYIEKSPTSLSPEKRRQRPIHEAIWHPPGPYIEKPPTSLSPEKKRQQPIHEPVWCPPGRMQYKPVPYFDEPNLRWSLQELLKSMPEIRSRSLRASRSVSVMRRSQDMTYT